MIYTCDMAGFVVFMTPFRPMYLMILGIALLHSPIKY